MKKRRIPLHRMVTRRDFLAQGFISFSATIAMPSLIGLGLRKALADGVPGAPKPPMPFMVFDLSGGGALPGNFLVGGAGGPQDLLPSYDILGWNPRAAGALYEGFGLPMAANGVGKMLDGILETTSPEARVNLRMGSFCHFGQDDSSSNPLNAASLALMSGSSGSFVTNGFCTMATTSGGNSEPVNPDLRFKPTSVESIDDVVGSARLGGQYFDGFNVDSLRALAQGAFRLSELQVAAYQQLPGGADLPDLSKRAYEGSIKYVEGSGMLDPRTNPETVAVFGLTAETPVNSENAVAASLAHCTLSGLSGPSVWTHGGGDYHNGDHVMGDQVDLAVGQRIGRAVELAHRLKKPLFFQLITDGGISADAGTRNWTSDAGDKSMSIIGYYRPEGPAPMRRQQVGHYTSGQGADDSTLIGANPRLAACAAFANYLAVRGELGKFHTYLPSVFAGEGELQSILLFEPC